MEELLSTPGIGDVLAEKIIENRPYDRMEGLLGIRGIGERRFGTLKSRFWCAPDR